MNVFLAYCFIPIAVTFYEFFDPNMELGFVATSFSVLFVYISLQAGKTNDLKMRQQILEELAVVDQLTGLLNRRAYDQNIEKGLYCKNTGVLFCDANRLKYVNDTFGHSAGDQLLISFADLLKANFTIEHVFRISGDEFVVFVPDISREKFAETVNSFRQLIIEKDNIASFGDAYCDNGNTYDVLSAAEDKMRIAKREFYQKYPQFNRRQRLR